ncbi:MAG TPA: nuclear transport factor 2 family protein [Methylocystis sp.]|nr:nuclear transport factor 2 family protein [Methylocystis sp.]
MANELALLAANAAYYDAFNARDDAAMAELWAHEQVSCVHPGWPSLVGRRAVLASFSQIFRNPRQQPIERQQESVIGGADEGRVICIERLGDAALVATNWFRLIGDKWLLLHHQASPLAIEAAPAAGRESMH